MAMGKVSLRLGVVLLACSTMPAQECTFFTPQGQARSAVPPGVLSALTRQVLAYATKGISNIRMAVPGGSRTDVLQDLSNLGTIDSEIFRAIQAAGASPAPLSDDFTFIRRVTLDLTGRVPTYDRIIQFGNDQSPDKRAKLIDELIASPEWVDKWTMYFGDLFKNVANNTQVNRYPEGRDAFYSYIKSSLASNKPYNVMATEMIAAQGANSWEQGELNWNVGGIVMGGPRGKGHDNWDQIAANNAETFLGLAHLNCLLCHDGRHHLDELSLWGKNTTRFEAWQYSAFFADTNFRTVRPDSTRNNRYYSVITPERTTGYTLDTTDGNRPPRQPIGSIKVISPAYSLGDGSAPNSGEPKRVAVARLITGDMQFARAAVNYLWKEFFGRGIVEPVNAFDPARIDPDNPPPAPWTLQPTNPALLNGLANDFIASGFDLHALMREIANSTAYQLDSWYPGQWNPEWETLFARKYVRRLWAEEVADALVQISGIGQTYTVTGRDQRLNWAMQLPETGNMRQRGVGTVLDSFFRGNRVDDFRRPDGSATQALVLMNDPFVQTRTRASGSGSTTSFARRLLLKYPAAVLNDPLIQEMFVTVLARVPTDEEFQTSRAALATASNNNQRQARVEDLLWALFNKVDFVYER